jgi:hypothetical protein
MPHKYHARATTIDGLRFPSQAEARRYRELKTLLAAGHIQNLRVHTRWPLIVQGYDCGTYESDFDYLNGQGQLVVEDVKGVITDLYRLKKKLMCALHHIDVVEVYA